MEAHHGLVSGSMATDDTDTLTPFVPQLTVSGSEASLASQDLPLDHGRGWICTPGETCPICGPSRDDGHLGLTYLTPEWSDDTDTLTPSGPRLTGSSSEASLTSQDSPLDHGCGCVCTPGETCPICGHNPATEASEDASHIPEETINAPQDLAVTASHSMGAVPAPSDGPRRQETQANHPQAVAEANDNVHLALAGRRALGVQMVFDLQMNPLQPASRRSKTKAVRMERRRKSDRACETCRKRKIRVGLDIIFVLYHVDKKLTVG